VVERHSPDDLLSVTANVGKLAGVATRVCAVAASVGAMAWTGSASAQSPARPFSREIYYSVAAGDGALPHIKRARIAGADLLSASVVERELVSTLPDASGGGPGVGDLIFAPDGDLLVAGAANKLYKTRVPTGEFFAVRVATAPDGGASRFNDAPTVMALMCDPSADKAWALGAESMVSIVGLLPGPTANVPRMLTGPETQLNSLVWCQGVRGSSGAVGSGPRVLYTSIETLVDGSTRHHLGKIDMATLSTTRLVSDLEAARVIVLDGYTGKLFAFGGTKIVQINPDPATPLIEHVLDVAALVGGAGMQLVDGTVDGEGRLFAIAADGRMVVADFSGTRNIASVGTRVRVLELDPSAAGGTPGGTGMVGMAPLAGPGRAQLAYCLWDNGDFDGRDGQVSRTDAYSGAPMTADDFYLEPGSVYRLDTITAKLSTNSILPKARLTLFDDCDGRPGAQLAAYESLRVDDTGVVANGLRVYKAEFPLGGMFVSTGRDGRSFWISVQGVGLGLPEEEWYWATAGNLHVRAKSGQFRSSALDFPDWTPVDEFGCGCTDFAFDLIGERCKTLYDGGELDLAAEPAGSLSQIAGVSESARSADNFVVPPCAPVETLLAVRETVCYLRAYIYSNCTPVRGQFELYENACKLPVDPSGPNDAPVPMFAAPFARVTDLGYSTVIDGQPLSAYCVEAVNLDWSLPAGHGYWLAAVGDTAFAFRKRNYFAFAARCDARVGLDGRRCRVTFSPAAVVGQGAGTGVWKKLSVAGEERDLAFLVAVRGPLPSVGSATGGSGGRPSCAADVDRSGTVSLQDVFEFLNAWFLGCP